MEPTPEPDRMTLRRQEGHPDDTVIVLGNAPDGLLAKRIAHQLVEESLVACAQVGASQVSMYLWEGKLEGGEEIPLVLKTSAQTLPRLYARYCALHPHAVPEFLIVGVAAGGADYLDWVARSCQASAARDTDDRD